MSIRRSPAHDNGGKPSAGGKLACAWLINGDYPAKKNTMWRRVLLVGALLLEPWVTFCAFSTSFSSAPPDQHHMSLTTDAAAAAAPPPVSLPPSPAAAPAPHSDEVDDLLRHFEGHFLRRLGLTRRPQRPPAFGQDGAPAVSDHMHRLYARFEIHNEWEDFVWDVGDRRKELGQISAVRSHQLLPDPAWRPHNSTLTFDLSSLAAEAERPVAGELRLFLNLTGPPGWRRVEVLERPRTSPLRLLHARRLPVPSAAWRHFDVSPALVRWARNPRWRRGGDGALAVRVAPSEADAPMPPAARVRRAAPPAPPEGVQWRRGDSELFSYHQSPQKRDRRRRRRKRKRGRRRRRKRKRMGSFPFQSGPQLSGRHGKRNAMLHPDLSLACQLRSLYVDFADVGWNEWIVAPPGYHAGLCDGSCNQFPLSDPYNTTNHAIIQLLVHSTQPEHVPPPCCVAIALSSKAILLFDENRNVVLKTYDEMVVDRCGCR